MPSRAQSDELVDAVARIRADMAPTPDNPRATQDICRDCGEAYLRLKRDPRRYCPRCGATRNLTGQDQMAAKRGPVYERAAVRQFQFWRAELQRLGIEPPASPAEGG